jgi:hypothetical protein
MASNITLEIFDSKIKILALCGCIDRLSICDAIPDRFVCYLNEKWKNNTLQMIIKLREDKVLSDTVNISDISNAFGPMEDVCNSYQLAESVTHKTLHAYKSFREYFSKETYKLIAVCGLKIDKVLCEVPKMQKFEPVSTSDQRYISHVNNTLGVTSESMLKLKTRLDLLCGFMYDRHVCCIPVLPDVGDRVFGDWLPLLKVRRVLQEAHITEDSYFCRIAMSTLIILQSIEHEVGDVLDELRAWKILQCAMALHPRIGHGSLLGLLGEDLVRKVVKVMLL